MPENNSKNLDAPLGIPAFTNEDIVADKIGYYGVPTDRLKDLPLTLTAEIADKNDSLSPDNSFEKETAIGKSYDYKIKEFNKKREAIKATTQDASIESDSINEEITYVNHLTQETLLDKKE